MKTVYLLTKPYLGVVADDDRGFGEAMLGKFLGQLAQAATAEDTVLCFYTEGVKAAVRGASAVPGLRALEEKGIALHLCGSCLEYYSLDDQVEVGTVSDMQTIAGALGGADKVVTI